jgi:hypothetical protein
MSFSFCSSAFGFQAGAQPAFKPDRTMFIEVARSRPHCPGGFSCGTNESFEGKIEYSLGNCVLYLCKLLLALLFTQAFVVLPRFEEFTLVYAYRVYRGLRTTQVYTVFAQDYT